MMVGESRPSMTPGPGADLVAASWYDMSGGTFRMSSAILLFAYVFTFILVLREYHLRMEPEELLEVPGSKDLPEPRRS
jgi:hypothetical protein